jgi:hypothetical protein
MGLDIWTASLNEISNNCGLSVGLERRQIRLRPTTPTLPTATTRAVVWSIVATSGSWGNPQFEHCKLPYTLKQLMEREIQGQPPQYRTGGLGRKMQQSIFEVRQSACQRFCVMPQRVCVCLCEKEGKNRHRGKGCVCVCSCILNPYPNAQTLSIHNNSMYVTFEREHRHGCAWISMSAATAVLLWIAGSAG